MELIEQPEETNPYLCLNMIVKNEAHIIKDTLTKLLNKIPSIDYWVISDTGSTDNTKEIVSEFFKERKIKGELFDDAWKDFGYNRTLALEHAFGKSKYVLIFDADDEICGNFVLPELILDAYHLQFGDANGSSYTRIQIVNNSKKWKYVGVLHEVITCTETIRESLIIKGNYYTLSGRSGARSRDPNKYLNDALILEKAYNEALQNKDELYNRYGFYCANSYYDCGKWEDAIKWYKITLDNKNWEQEKYVSCLRLYNCYRVLKQTETGTFYLVKSFSYDKERPECLFELVAYYAANGLSDIAYNYYNMVKSFYNERYLKNGLNNKLFLDVSAANLFLPYFMVIICDTVKDYETALQMYKIIFTKKHIERSKHHIGNLLFNLQFYIDSNTFKKDQDLLPLFKEYIDFLISINYPIHDHNDFMVKYEKYGITLPKIAEPTFSRDDCFKSKNILVYAGYAPFKWNYTFSLNNALGGSETAVASLTKNFPNTYTIYVAGVVEEETIDNVTYIDFKNLSNLIKTTPFHTIIVSRYLNFYELYKNFSAHQTFIWAHDILLYEYGTNLSVESILTKWSSKITGCICQTEWHKNLFLSLYPQLKDKINTINNGINTQLFNSNNSNIKPKKITNRFIYTSCSERGLYKLVQLWQSILENLPDAELMISSYNNFPNSDEDIKILEIIRKTPSIKHMGKLNRTQLYNLMSSAEYWLYPSYFQETSCITSLELLASEVICLYYPVAGLVNTVGDYGIPISDGNEIDTLLSLSIKKKTELKKRGQEYALSCSWQNRADEWSNLMSLNNNDNNYNDDKISIINSLPFHYEMFGFILNYAKNNNIFVDIFTNTNNNMGWLSFYKNKFSNFRIIDINNFDKLNTQKYKYIFVTTDDDAYVMNKGINYDNIIVINHFWKIRNPYAKRYLNCAPFKDSKLDFCYPIYPIFNAGDKNVQNIITIVGGGEVVYNSLKYNYNIDVINRFCFNNEMPITLNFICRGLNDTFLKGLSTKFKINIYSDIDTNKMMDILKESNYIYVTFSNCNDKNSGHSCSGALQLAFNTLCKPIILKETNQILNIANCIEYTNENDEPIYLDSINLNALENEREMYIEKFDKYLKYNTALIIEPRDDDTVIGVIRDFNKKLNNGRDNWKIVFYCGKNLKAKWVDTFKDISIEIRELNTNNFTQEEYSDFCKNERLWESLYGKFVLVFQLDTIIRNEEPYTIDYFLNLNKSYIGGNMSYNWNQLIRENIHMDNRNFNGGLSLRNRLDMIKIIQVFTPESTVSPSYKMTTDAEDVYFTLGCYKLKLKLGDDETSSHFAIHTIIKDTFFGCHNPCLEIKEKLVDVYPEAIKNTCIYKKDFINSYFQNKIKEKFNYECNRISDINEHLVPLYIYAKECESIIECGVRGCVSSWAFAAGLLDNNKPIKRILLNDIEPCNIDDFLKLTQNTSLIVNYEWCSDLDLQVNPNVDLTFIDTFHVYGQLKRELDKFSKITNKYIIMHDTTVDEIYGECIRSRLNAETLSLTTGLPVEEINRGLQPAIDEFLICNSNWILYKKYTNNNGLTVLKKIEI